MNLKNDGIILVNKEKNYTSRDVVNIVSKKLKTKKVGHTGTLDPLAEGVLVICVGKATKLCDILTSDKKEYIASCVFGLNTDTLDITGNIIKEDYKYISKDEVENALNSFKKTYDQEVPIYSAVKVNGMKLYEYARNGLEVELPKKEVTIYDIELLYYEYTDKVKITFKCTVSKGTYIRALIRDIAEFLDTYGTMTDLIRTQQGNFDIKDTYMIKDIENDNFEIIPIIDAINIPKKIVAGEAKKKIINGSVIKNADLVFYIDEKNNPLAIYENGHVLKMFYEFDKDKTL